MHHTDTITTISSPRLVEQIITTEILFRWQRRLVDSLKLMGQTIQFVAELEEYDMQHNIAFAYLMKACRLI